MWFPFKVRKNYRAFLEEFLKNSSRYARVDLHSSTDEKMAEALMNSRFAVVLDERGEELDSFGFSSLISSRARVDFFVGGASGFGEKFRHALSRYGVFLKSDRASGSAFPCKKLSGSKGSQLHVIALSSMTFQHEVSLIVLVEQIWRALAIAGNHPYPK